MTATQRFLKARDVLLREREDLLVASRDFRWPHFEYFNWAWDYLDVVAADNEQIAIRVCDDAGSDQSLSFAMLADRSLQVASFLSELGIGPGDRVLIMLGNVLPLWEVMLATMRLGAVMIPASTLIQHDDLRDRIERGGVKAVVTHDTLTDRFAGIPGAPVRVCVGGAAKGWITYEQSHSVRAKSVPRIHTRADDLLLLYFTSGTTAKPKLVAHTLQLALSSVAQDGRTSLAVEIQAIAVRAGMECSRLCGHSSREWAAFTCRALIRQSANSAGESLHANRASRTDLRGAIGRGCTNPHGY